MESATPLERAAKIAGGGKVSFNALAEKIGRSQSTMQRWKNRGWPAPDACPAIEAATGVSTAELLKPAMKVKRDRKRAA